ncbi:MAG: class I SAM-dependent methyltransferase [Saprospiraceae bacterium]
MQQASAPPPSHSLPVSRQWYAEWFNDPAYHVLYQNHDDTEAKQAIDGLLRALKLPEGARLLDLACGRGRHARYLAHKGYDVTGLDISADSISAAQDYAHDGLHFYRHDMRKPFRIRYFDGILNFFTSFGYFDREADHLKTLQNVRLGLREEGVFLLDFFNAGYVRERLVESERRELGGYVFDISRRCDATHVYKRIAVRYPDGGRREFVERVRLYEAADFEALFARCGLRLCASYGDYALQDFDPANSPRLILVAEKKG